MGDKVVPIDGSYAQVSGLQIVDFLEGWAIETTGAPGKRAHFYKRRQFDREAVSLCGLSYPVYGLFHAGSFYRCKRCERKMKPTSGPKAAVVPITDTAPNCLPASSQEPDLQRSIE